MIDGFPLSFFLPLVVHALAARLRTWRLWSTTLSEGSLAAARAGKTVDSRPCHRDDWVLRCPVDRLLRRQRPPDPRLDAAPDTHVLGASHHDRAPIPGGVPLAFRSKNR
jgi:hypothetical protein